MVLFLLLLSKLANLQRLNVYWKAKRANTKLSNVRLNNAKLSNDKLSNDNLQILNFQMITAKLACEFSNLNIKSL